MTFRPGQPRPGWEVAVCCASGPSFSAQQADLIIAARAANRCRVVCANESYRRVPNADAMYAQDVNYFKVHAETIRANFAGEVWTPDHAAAKRWGFHFIEGVNRRGLSPSAHVIHKGGNSGYGAISLAVAFGARRLILVGYDLQAPGGVTHWHGDHVGQLLRGQPFVVWIPRFVELARDFERVGIAAVNCSPASALTCFPLQSLDDALAACPTQPKDPAQ